MNENLLDFIALHVHSHLPHYNTIDGIIASSNISDQIKEISEKLGQKWEFLDYSSEEDPDEFYRKFAQAIFEKNVIYIFVQSDKIDEEFYNHLYSIRLSNQFVRTGLSPRNDHFINPLPEETHIFLVFDSQKTSNLNYQVWDMVDHCLETDKTN
jgi:hypothetical protein